MDFVTTFEMAIKAAWHHKGAVCKEDTTSPMAPLIMTGLTAESFTKLGLVGDAPNADEYLVGTEQPDCNVYDPESLTVHLPPVDLSSVFVVCDGVTDMVEYQDSKDSEMLKDFIQNPESLARRSLLISGIDLKTGDVGCFCLIYGYDDKGKPVELNNIRYVGDVKHIDDSAPSRSYTRMAKVLTELAKLRK